MHQPVKLHSAALILLVFLSGCSLFSQEGPANEAVLLIIEPYDGYDLDDGRVKQAVADYIEYKNAPAFTQYDFMRVDLNNDNHKDALVYLTAPYGQWCNAQGCSLLVFEAQPYGFALVGEISPVRAPVYINVAQDKKGQWHDMIVRVSGTEAKAKDVILRFNGSTYPSDPRSLPRSAVKRSQNIIKIFP